MGSTGDTAATAPGERPIRKTVSFAEERCLDEMNASGMPLSDDTQRRLQSGQTYDWEAAHVQSSAPSSAHERSAQPQGQDPSVLDSSASNYNGGQVPSEVSYGQGGGKVGGAWPHLAAFLSNSPLPTHVL